MIYAIPKIRSSASFSGLRQTMSQNNPPSSGQVLRRAKLDRLTLAQHEHPVKARHGREPVRDDGERRAGEGGPGNALQGLVRGAVDGAGRLVEDEHARGRAAAAGACASVGGGVSSPSGNTADPCSPPSTSPTRHSAARSTASPRPSSKAGRSGLGARFSRSVPENRKRSCDTSATAARAAPSRGVDTSTPSTSTRPPLTSEERGTKRARAAARVLLPAPMRPTTPRRAPPGRGRRRRAGRAGRQGSGRR
jgi:hypothetical protein